MGDSVYLLCSTRNVKYHVIKSLHCDNHEESFFFFFFVNNNKYHRQQNKCYPPKVSDFQKNCSSRMKFDRSNKFDLCYYGQANSLLLKSRAASKWVRKHLWG